MLALLLQLAVAQAPQKLAVQEYAVDAGHSIVEFSVPFAISRVKGRFPQTHGTILYDPAAPERSSVSVVIETKGIDTGWPHRDEHLRTEDFFDVDKYPTITFQSQRLERSGDSWIVTGPFTMHGVTKLISVPFRFLEPPNRNPESRWMIMNVAGALRISRKDFGVLGGAKHNSWFTAAREATVGDSVDISIELEGYYPDAVSQRPASLAEGLERIRTGGVSAQLDRWRERRSKMTDAQWAPYFTGGDFAVRALVADGRLTEAASLSRGLAEQLFPTLSRAWLVNGFALDASGDRSGAARSYERARQVFQPPVVDPNEKFPQVDNNWWYADQLVHSALEWGRVREGTALARAVAGIYGSSARAHVTLGMALAMSGDTRGARAEYQRALEIDPNETRATEWLRRLNG